jgi:hypothetical protein
MIIKNRRRDTAWFRIIEEEWHGHVKEALERWLLPGNFDEEGKQKRKLEEIRGEILRELQGERQLV